MAHFLKKRMFNCLAAVASILTLINSTVVSASSTVWPDMVKLRHFGEIFSNLWQFFEGSFSIWRKSEYTLAKVRSYWAHIFNNVKGLILEKVISHLVTLIIIMIKGQSRVPRSAWSKDNGLKRYYSLLLFLQPSLCSVTRFGKISPLWKNVKSLWLFFWGGWGGGLN